MTDIQHTADQWEPNRVTVAELVEIIRKAEATE